MQCSRESVRVLRRVARTRPAHKRKRADTGAEAARLEFKGQPATALLSYFAASLPMKIWGSTACGAPHGGRRLRGGPRALKPLIQMRRAP